MSVLRFKLTMNGDRTAVSLKVGNDSADAPFLFENPEGSRISKVLTDFSNGIASFDDVREIGTYLFSGLLQGDVETLFEKARAEIEQSNTGGGEEQQCVIRLIVPPELQTLPWESFYDESHRGFLLNHRQYTLIREAERVEATPRVGQGKLPLSMLVVVPDGSRLKVETELHQLAVVVDKLGANVEYVELAERVTSTKLGDHLRKRNWDIVHFIGHGDLIKGKAHIRLNTDGEEDNWMYGEQFAMLFDEKAPRLVVLNCCYGGREEATPTLSGVGPFLLRAGIPAVVAMQYAIRDVVASHFSETFYTELLTGERPGRIDLALARARKRLCIDHAGLAFATPVLYLADGRASLFEPGAAAAATAAPASVTVVSPAVPEPAAVPAGPALPKDLLDALVDRRCVPVIGADFLSLGATRAGPLSLRPRDLAVHLATEADCLPLIEQDVKGTDETDDEDLLPRVCQLFEKRNERYKLLLAVQRAYKDLQPPPLADTVASWDVPGMICLYFDGLIHAAMSRRGVGPRSIMAPEETLNGFKGEPLLLHLRGHYVDPDSLVLTERDHDQLYDRLGRISPAIADVLVRKQIGMTALYLGVSPQNRLLRRLTNVLRSPRNRPGSCGPIYFVCRESDDIDEAYWRDYDVVWLRFEPIELVSALSNALVKARQ